MSDYINLGNEIVFKELNTSYDDKVSKIVSLLDNNSKYNIIYCDDIDLEFMSCVSKHMSNITKSISFMKNFKLMHWEGTYDYNSTFIVFHSGINFDENDKQELVIRHFSTMSYLYSTVVYVTLSKCNKSDYYLYT